MKYLSLFSGIGGFELGMPDDFECVGYSEIEPRAIKIYEKHFPNHKNYGDITKIATDNLPDFDLLVGGFPCQDLSIAGRREGLSGNRSGLFFEIMRIIRVKRPTHLLLENVKHLLVGFNGEAFKTIMQSLDELGYDIEWALFYSSDFGRPQSRPRVYIKGTLRGSGFDACKRNFQKAPILFECKKRFRNTDYDWEKIGRVSTEIIRDDAGVPIGLDERSAKNSEEFFTR